MADFQTMVDKEKDLTTITVTGLLTIDDISSAIENFYDNPTRLVLWDSNNSELSELSAVDLEKATRLISHVKTNAPPGRTAFVVETDKFGLGVLFEGLTKIKNLPREYRSFTSREEAMCWLEKHC